MPRAPKGEKCPADAIGAAVMGAKIATGEILEDIGGKPTKNEAAVALGRLGGQARAKKLGKKRRAEIARQAAIKRWN